MPSEWEVRTAYNIVQNSCLISQHWKRGRETFISLRIAYEKINHVEYFKGNGNCPETVTESRDYFWGWAIILDRITPRMQGMGLPFPQHQQMGKINLSKIILNKAWRICCSLIMLYICHAGNMAIGLHVFSSLPSIDTLNSHWIYLIT